MKDTQRQRKADRHTYRQDRQTETGRDIEMEK